MKKELTNFFLEAGINHFGQLDHAEKVLRFFLKSSFKNITFMIHSEKFYKKYKKRGLDFKLSNNFYYNAIKKCNKKKKKFGLAVCDNASFKDKRNLNVDFYKLLSIGIDDYKLINMLKIKKKPVYISTGFNVSEIKIKNSIRLFDNSNHIQLLHTPMSYRLDELNLKKISIYKKKFKLPTGYSNHFNNKKIFCLLSNYKPSSVFLYCKPIKKKGRIYPDDQHAFYLNELENIKSSYNYASKVKQFSVKRSFSNKKVSKVKIFNEIKF